MINLYYDLKTGIIGSYSQSPAPDENPPEGYGVANIPDTTPFLDPATYRVAVHYDLVAGKVALTGV